MEAERAAQALLTKLNAPIWALSVAYMLRGGSTVLVVRVDPSYNAQVDAPSEFEGYPVLVEVRELARAFG